MASNTLRFEKLLQTVPDALVGMDQKGVIRFVNRQTELLFGYDRDELTGQTIDTLVPETLWQIYAQHQQDYFADPRTRSSGLDLELSGRRRNGIDFPIYVSMSHIDTGDVLLVITAKGDIAQQQQAIKSAGLASAIVEYSDDAIIGTTLEGRITSWNPAAEKLYGYSSREVMDRSVSFIVPQDRAGETAAVHAKIKAGGHVEHLETDRVRRDGTVVPVSMSVAPILDAEGEVVGASGVHRDVTVQRQAFEAAQRLASIVESSSEAIVGRNLDGIITSWNPAAERMYGYSAADILGKPIDLFLPEDQADTAEAILAKIKAGKPIDHLETEFFRKDGTTVAVSLTVSPIRDAGGELVGTSVIHRDISEMKAARHREPDGG